jgi:hypothetical protein
VVKYYKAFGLKFVLLVFVVVLLCCCFFVAKDGEGQVKNRGRVSVESEGEGRRAVCLPRVVRLWSARRTEGEGLLMRDD